MADNKRGGLSNKDALRIFIKNFDEFIEKIDSFILPSKDNKIRLLKFLDYVFISYLLIIGISVLIKIKLFPDDRDNNISIITTIFTIVVIYFVILIFHKILKKQKITQNLQKLRDEIISTINTCTNKNSKYYTDLEEYEGNFYYGYDTCFVQTLRNQEWVRIPNNVIVEGDYIKINIGDKSPADVKCVDYRYMPGDTKWDFCLKKDEVFKGFDDSFNDSHLWVIIQNKYDKIFRTKDEWVFEVINDPFVETLELYVKNYQLKSHRERKNINIISRESKKSKITIFLLNILSVFLILFYSIFNLTKDQNNVDQEYSLRSYLDIMVNPFTFFLAFIFIYFNLINKFLLFWANAAISILKDNIFTNTIDKSDCNSNKKESPINQSQNNLNKKNSVNCDNLFSVTENDALNNNSHINKIFGDKNYFLDSDFNEFSLNKHFIFYLSFFIEGIDKSYNLLNVSGSLNRLCFLEKEALIFEKEKEVVELAFFKSDNNVEVLNVQSEEGKLNGKENDYYYIEEFHNNKEEIENSLKPIALCSSVIRIPVENDKTNNLIFLESNKIKNLKKILPVSKLNKYSRILKEKSGYLFSATHENLRLHFKDCLCLLTKSIGFSERILNSYKNIKNVWHTNFIKYENNEFENQKKIITENLDETEESIIYESVEDENNIINLKENNQGDLIISSIIHDEILNNLNYFSRGSPSSVLNLCEDYWNGRTVEPLGREIIQKMSSLMQQWQSSNIHPIAFSYKPTKKSILDIIDKYNLDLEISDKSILHILKHNSMPQVFLGMVAMKNNLKNSFQDLLETLNEAGIIFVFFSKEDVKNTKRLADIVLCEYDFNQCISLKSYNTENNNQKVDNFNIESNRETNRVISTGNNNEIIQNEQININIQETTKILNSNNNNNVMLNQEGNKFLPTGVDEIKEFLGRKDEVPLLINLFSDSNINEVIDLLQIYQDYGEIIGCLTSTLNNENIPALAVSDINFGINIKPSFVCQNCNGMRNDFLNKKNPTIFEFISMKINSIFCPFVIDENTNYSSLTKIMTSARFLSYRIKLIQQFFTYLINYLIILQLPSYLVMTEPILDSYSIIIILFFLFPIILVGMLTINKSFDHIKKLKGSERIKQKLFEHDSFMLKFIVKHSFNFSIIGFSIIIFNVVYFIKLNEISNYVSTNVVLVKKLNNETNFLTFSSVFRNFNYTHYNIEKSLNLTNLEYDFYLNTANTNSTNTDMNLTSINSTDVVKIILNNFEYLNVVFFYIVIWFICCLSFLFIDKYHSVFSAFFFKNYKFILSNCVVIFFSTCVFLGRFYSLNNNIVILFEQGYIMLLLFSILSIFIFDHLNKLYIVKRFSNKQKKIKLIIETRLGTYSPK